MFWTKKIKLLSILYLFWYLYIFIVVVNSFFKINRFKTTFIFSPNHHVQFPLPFWVLFSLLPFSFSLYSLKRTSAMTKLISISITVKNNKWFKILAWICLITCLPICYKLGSEKRKIDLVVSLNLKFYFHVFWSEKNI